MEHSCEAVVVVDRKYTSHIIGRAGSNINELSKQTDTRIDLIDDDRTSPTCTLRITGTQEGIQKAKAKVESLVAELASAVQTELALEPAYIAHLSQSRQSMTRQWREKYPSVMVSFDEASAGRLSLKGKREEVETLASELAALAEQFKAWVTIDCDIPAAQRGSVIGRNGANIHRIIDEHHVQIEIPRSGDDLVNVKIVGTESNAVAARQALLVRVFRTSAITSF